MSWRKNDGLPVKIERSLCPNHAVYLYGLGQFTRPFWIYSENWVKEMPCAESWSLGSRSNKPRGRPVVGGPRQGPRGLGIPNHPELSAWCRIQLWIQNILARSHSQSCDSHFHSFQNLYFVMDLVSPFLSTNSLTAELVPTGKGGPVEGTYCRPVNLSPSTAVWLCQTNKNWGWNLQSWRSKCVPNGSTPLFSTA